MTERTSREKATRMHYAAQFLDSEDATADMQQLARDYLALLDEHDRYREALEEIDRIAAPYIAEAGFDSIAGLAFAALNGGTDDD